MTKSELAPYLNAVTNEERTFLICQTSEGAYIGESSPTCAVMRVGLASEDGFSVIPLEAVQKASLLRF